MKIAVFFVGEVHDSGFNASALDGARAAEGLAEIKIISGLPYDQAAIRMRLNDVVPQVDGVVFIGGQGSVATPEFAAAYPDKRFAVIQGQEIGANLASYDVRQEDSAFLAGVLAAHMTQTGIVGHLSGHRVKPGMKGRAAFVAGVAHANSCVKVLTGFCGTQDDNSITQIWANAQIAAGADIIFTMLNGARSGAIEACRAHNVHQIGNALDWVPVAPDVFLASAIARIDLGVERAIADMAAKITPKSVVQFGLTDGACVRLSMGDNVSSDAKEQVAIAEQNIRAGEITIPSTYDGPEFQLKDSSCAAKA